MGFFEFFLVGLALVGGAVALARWLEPTRRARRALARVPEKRLDAAAEGDRARIRGVARPGEAGLTSPITGRPCIGYRVLVEEYVRDNDGGAWRTVVEKDDCAPFELVDDGLLARVEGPFLFGLEIDARTEDSESLMPHVLDALERQGNPRTDSWGRERLYRFREAILEQGDPIFVLGHVSMKVDPRGEREGFRDPPRIRVIRGTARQPTVLADELQPGVLLA